MHYHIYCNTKHIHSNHTLALEEFKKRLSAYCETTLHTSSVLQLPKEMNPDKHHFILIHRGHSTHTSEEWATKINALQHSGKSTIHILIGYDETVLYDMVSNMHQYGLPTRLSLSNSSLSIDTTTLLFYEQLYRGYTILQGKTYHK
ncbi:MAG: 23S rRNA (pseudouridine(1915)-N(3))-methyltransferase RlmH [Lachnospiraceae bacterium]|nr:23S rRNA (pseudouridine(1915)-N(3))-methyltransferase RlmH [Lachnospiraceae bacterium]